MAQITLRSYVEYIEDRLQRDAHPEVVAQCRYVLDAYPKYVEIYKLLARSLLDQENYQDALDLFQRVLSADPNDFLAHVGISECYRENGALDQAIWHLERAFEQVPNNNEIQDEIRRLYAERDGQAPHRLYLTNGALARLYLRGRLHEQAIAELRAALAKDPERTDLRVLLAQTLWEYQAAPEAGQVAAEVLRQLPNSIDANRILALLWLLAGERDEAYLFLERLRALDPYLAHRTEHGGAPPAADAFRLEMLEYTASRHAAEIGAADWVAQLDGIGKQPVSPTVEPAAEPGDEAYTPLEEATPAWLSELDDRAEDTGAGAALDAEMPTLDELAGAFELLADEGDEAAPDDDETQAGAAPESESTPEWLTAILADETGTTAAPDAPAVEAEAEVEAPRWLAEIIDEEADALQPVESDERETAPEPGQDEQPDWLSELLDVEADEAAAAGEVPETEMPAPQPPPDEPDWLSELLAEETDEAEEEAPRMPESPQPAAEAEGEAAETFEALADGDDDTPDWLSEILAEEESPELAQAADSEEAPVAEDAAAQPGWLTDDAGEQRSEPEADGATGDEAPDEEPDWLSEILAEEADEPYYAPEAEEAPAEEMAGDEPDWLSEVLAEETDEPPHALEEQADDEVLAEEAGEMPPALETGDWSDEPPAWLSAIPGEPAVPPFGEDETFTAQPDWLNDVWGERIGGQLPETPRPAAPEETIPSGEWQTEGEDTAAEDEPPPEAADADWQSEAEVAPAGAPADLAPEDETGDDLAPDWLRQELLGEQGAEDDAADWLREELTEPASAEDDAPAREDTGEAEPPDDMPGWLRDTLAETDPAIAEISSAEPPARAEPPEAEPEMPEWLHDAIHGQQPAVTEPTLAAPEGEAEPADVVSDDWLDEIIGSPEPDEMALDEAADEWLADMGQASVGDPFEELETWDEAVDRLEQAPPPPLPAAPLPEAEPPEPPSPEPEPEPESEPEAEATPRSRLLSRLREKNLGTDKLKSAPPPAPDLPDWLHDPSLAVSHDTPDDSGAEDGGAGT